MRIRVESNYPEWRFTWDGKLSRVAPGRNRGVRVVSQQVLSQVVERHPVDTGRSRAAWQTALRSLGLTTGDGTGVADGEGSMTVREADRRTEIEAVNHVEYEQYVEYGSRGRPGAAMVRTSLEEARTRIGAILRTEILNAMRNV